MSRRCEQRIDRSREKRFSKALVPLAVVAIANAGCASVVHPEWDVHDTFGDDGTAPMDERTDIPIDVRTDVPIDDGYPADRVPHPCEDGPNLGRPLSICSGTDAFYFAFPFRPARDMLVTTMTTYIVGGELAILASRGSDPGPVLFSGSLMHSPVETWRSIAIDPPVCMRGGDLYFLVERTTSCSFVQGGSELTEYSAPTLEGPWVIQGTGTFTARLDGVCD